MNYLPPPPSNLPRPLRKLATIVASVAVVGLALMFSVVVVAFIVVAGAIAWSYLWWKTRELRKQMRQFPRHSEMKENGIAETEVVKGEIIEGEVIHVTDSKK